MHKPKLFNKRSGFTLIEMAVVLVIIGLILGAVSVGKDLQRNAEYKKVKQKFIDQWAQAYNQYYEKYGIVIGDSETDPTMVINGAGAATFGGAGGYTSSGAKNLATATAPNRICQGASNDPDTTNGRTATQTLHTFFDNAGIRMPPGRAEGNEDRYIYLDSNGNPQEVQICFQWNPPTTSSGSGNVMVLIGLTPDLARAIDQMIDGKPDAREGMFRQQGVAHAAHQTAGIAWAATNTQVFAAATGAGAATNLDENQVAVVTAHYKMNQ